MKFCVSNGITATESLKMLQKCFGESTLSRTQVFEWHKAFREGREVVENFPHASCPSTSINVDDIEKVKKIVPENRRVGIREVAEAVNISHGSTQHIVVHVFGMKRVAVRLVPNDLNFPAWLWLNFWLNTKQKSFLSHHIRQIWLHVSFPSFQNSNIRSGERATSRLRP